MMVFDYIATAARILSRDAGIHFFEEYSSMDPACKSSLEVSIKNEVPALFDNNTIRQLALVDLSSECEVAQQVHQYIQKNAQNKNHMAIMLLLEYVCNALLEYIDSLTDHHQDYRPIQYLNRNSDSEKMIVLPYYPCDWQHNDMRTLFENGINNHINNIYVIDITQTVGKYTIKNYLLNDDLFQRAKKNERLRIGMSPLTCLPAITNKNMTTSSRDNIRVFGINGIQYEKEINQSFISILEKARREEYDILLFPEMIGTEETRKTFEQFCLENEADASLSNPEIIVLPSIWQNRNNKAYVYIGDFNPPIAQQKTYRYPFDDNEGCIHLEDLDVSRANEIHVLHSKHLGRIVVAICKDLLIKEHIEFLIGDLKASLVLVPSFSTGHYPFQMISYYGFPYDCHIAWINTCAASHVCPPDKTMDIVGMVYNPSRSGVDGVPKMFPESKCSQKCNECLFSYEIKLKGE